MNRTTRLLIIASLFTIALLAGSDAEAQSATATLNVSFEKTGSCTIAAGGLVFDASGAGTATLTANCVSGAAYSIGIDWGEKGLGAATRKLTGADGTTELGYKLFQDAAYTKEWNRGCGTSGGGCGTVLPGTALAGTGTGAAQSITVYGKITDSLASAPAQAYSDNVKVYIDF